MGKEAIEYHMEQKANGIGVNQKIFLQLFKVERTKSLEKWVLNNFAAFKWLWWFCNGGLSVGEPNADM